METGQRGRGHAASYWASAILKTCFRAAKCSSLSPYVLQRGVYLLWNMGCGLYFRWKSLSTHILSLHKLRIMRAGDHDAVHAAGCWAVRVACWHAGDFPAVTALTPEFFQRCEGTPLKQERLTTIVHVSRLPDAAVSLPQAVALKTYRYRGVGKLRTWRAMPKAEREYLALAQCAALGVPVLEPVACGTVWDRLGMVESSFLLTRFMEGVVSMRDWFKQGKHESPAGAAFLRESLSEMGGHMRALHQARFFFLGCPAKNVLISEEGAAGDKWVFADMPYARFLDADLLARQGQRWDLGSLYGTVTKYAGEGAFDSFYASYLPQPLPGSEAALRRRVRKYGRVHNKQDMLSHIKRRIYPVILPWKSKQ